MKLDEPILSSRDPTEDDPAYHMWWINVTNGNLFVRDDMEYVKFVGFCPKKSNQEDNEQKDNV
jgi:hypothetical protein